MIRGIPEDVCIVSPFPIFFIVPTVVTTPRTCSSSISCRKLSMFHLKPTVFFVITVRRIPADKVVVFTLPEPHPNCSRIPFDQSPTSRTERFWSKKSIFDLLYYYYASTKVYELPCHCLFQRHSPYRSCDNIYPPRRKQRKRPQPKETKMCSEEKLSSFFSTSTSTFIYLFFFIF